MDLKPIGVIHSPYKSRGEAPFQGRMVKDPPICEVEVFKEYSSGLKDVETFSHLILIYWLHEALREKLLTYTPHGPDLHGVFATRSPNRPNPIGLCVVELVERRDNLLKVKGLDAIDNTPLIDIKPYIPGIDIISDANSGWTKNALKRRKEIIE